MPRRHSVVAIAAVVVTAGLVAFSLTGDEARAQAQTGRLTLEARPGPTGIEVVAALTDPQNRPLRDTEIEFWRRTAFSWLEIGRLATDRDGSARLVLPSEGGSLDVRAVATIGEATLSTTVRLDLGGVLPLRVRPGEATLGALSPQPGFISPYPPLGLLLALGPILAGVWLTYAVVIYQIYRIARPG